MLHAIENAASSSAKNATDKLFSAAQALLGSRSDTLFGERRGVMPCTIRSWPLKSSVPPDWRRILGSWIAREFVYAASALREEKVTSRSFGRSSKRTGNHSTGDQVTARQPEYSR